MKCVIIGIKPQDYTNRDNKHVKGYQFNLLSDNTDVFGKVFKDCFIAADSPVYLNNLAIMNDLNQLLGREVNAEWDVEQYGQKSVKRLISFEFTDKFFDLVERESIKPEKGSK